MCLIFSVQVWRTKPLNTRFCDAWICRCFRYLHTSPWWAILCSHPQHVAPGYFGQVPSSEQVISCDVNVQTLMSIYFVLMTTNGEQKEYDYFKIKNAHNKAARLVTTHLDNVTEYEAKNTTGALSSCDTDIWSIVLTEVKNAQKSCCGCLQQDLSHPLSSANELSAICLSLQKDPSEQPELQYDEFGFRVDTEGNAFAYMGTHTHAHFFCPHSLVKLLNPSQET